MEPNKFRLNRKSALLTYPNVTENIDFEEIYDTLAKISDIKRCVIGRERHAIGGQLHFHVFIEWQRKVDLKGLSGRDKLLIRGFGVHVSKHRKGDQGKRTCYEYCIKDGDYWESTPFDLFTCSKNFLKEFADFTAWKQYRSSRALENPFPFVDPLGNIINKPLPSEK